MSDKDGKFGDLAVKAINDAFTAVHHHNRLYWHYIDYVDTTLFHYSNYSFDDEKEIVCNKRYIKFCRHIPVFGKKLEDQYVNNHKVSSYFHIDHMSIDHGYPYISKFYSDEEILFYLYRRSSIEGTDLYLISHELGLVVSEVDKMLYDIVYSGDNENKNKPAPAPTRDVYRIG